MVCYSLMVLALMFTVGEVHSETEDFQKVIFAQIDLDKDPENGGVKVESVTIPNGAVDWTDLDNGGVRAWEQLEKFKPTEPALFQEPSDEPVGRSFIDSETVILIVIVICVFVFYGLSWYFCPDRLFRNKVVYIRFRDSEQRTAAAPV